MLKALRPAKVVTNQSGFTLVELLVVVLIVGVLAAAGIPLYLGYVRDSRLAEAKAIAGSVLTAAQGCAQVFQGAEDANCTIDKIAPKAGLKSDNTTADGKWLVSYTNVLKLTAGTNVLTGGPINVAGQIAPVSNMAAAVHVDGQGRTSMTCNTTTTTAAPGDPSC